MDFDGLQFQLFSNEEIHRYSVATITEPIFYDKQHPKFGGINDLRLGIMNRKYLCSTCQKNIIYCPGHFGEIHLAFPIYHIEYISVIQKILSLICYFCSSFLIVPAELAAKGFQPFQPPTCSSSSFSLPPKGHLLNRGKKDKFEKLSKCKRLFLCKHCGAPQPQYIVAINGIEVMIRTIWKVSIAKYTKMISKPPPPPILSSPSSISTTTTTTTTAIANTTSKKRKRNNNNNKNNKKEAAISTIHFTEEEIKEEEIAAKARPSNENLKLLIELSKKPFTAADALLILNGISNELAYYMGFYIHPRNMILTYLAVPPPIIRPASVTQEGKIRSNEDLTEKLKDIVIRNNAIRKIIQQITNDPMMTAFDENIYTILFPTISERDKMNLFLAIKELQYHVTVLFNNEVHKLKQDRQRSGAATKSYSMRMKHKEGRFRQNIIGKRVDFSARSVIVPDPNIDVDELGVPYEIAMTQTIPEVVTLYNQEILQKKVLIGSKDIHGARYVIYKKDPTLSITTTADMFLSSASASASCIVSNSGASLNTKFNPIKKNERIVVDLSMLNHQSRAKLKLPIGTIVECYLHNEQAVIFNRQPSLHKQSMMGHRVRIMESSEKPFRLNLAVVTPYNADFDGDEMNLHVPQSLEATAEVKELMMVPLHLVTAKASKPCIGLTQDSCIGLFFLTRRDTFLNKSQFCQLLSQCRHFEEYNIIVPKPAIIKPTPLWTGKQLVSCLFPADFCYQKNRSEYSNNESYSFFSDLMDANVFISNGILLSGRLCKETIGVSIESIFHHLWRRKKLKNEETQKKTSEQLTCAIISDLQRIANFYLMERGFSIGIGDNVLPIETQQQINDYQNLLMKKLSLLYEEMIDKKSYSIAELEPHVSALLRKGLSMTSMIADNALTDQNPVYAMVHSGSRGNAANIGQMMACIGQQSQNGERLFGVPLPSFPLNSRIPESKGYVRNSLYEGLSVIEFFEHAIGGREGLIDTAVKTAHTGYIQRCLMQSMNEIYVETDGTIRKSNRYIVQFQYGADGFDAAFILRVYLPPINISIAIDKFWKYSFGDYCIKQQNNDEMEMIFDIFLNREIEILTELHHKIYSIRSKAILFQQHQQQIETLIYQPCNIIQEANVLFGVFHQQKMENKKITEITIDWHFQELYRFILKLNHHFGYNPCRDIYIRHSLCSKKIIVDWCIEKKEAFLTLLDRIYWRYEKAKVHINEMVGALAAESIGEPCTQMTLNTFHSAGQGTRVVTTGIPRMKELLFLLKKIKTPTATLHINSNFVENNETLFYSWTHLLPHTLLKNAIELEKVQFLWEPNPFQISPIDPILTKYNAFFSVNATAATTTTDHNDNNDNSHHYSFSRWVIRFELKRNFLIDRGLTPNDIARTIRNYMAIPRMGDFSTYHNLVIASETTDETWILRIRIPNIYNNNNTNNTSLFSKEYEYQLCQHIAYDLAWSIELCGLPGITGSTFQKKVISSSSSAYYIVDTKGSNLSALWMLDGVDWTLTTSNVLQEMNELLGIEALVEVLFYELKQVLSDTVISDRHILILVDTITRTGSMVSTSRFGFNRQNAPLSRASFEETLSNLQNAAMFGEYDPLNDIIGNITMGQTIPAGTGKTNFIVDPKYRKYTKQKESELKEWLYSIIDDVDISNDISYDNIIFINSSAIPLKNILPMEKKKKGLKESTKEFQKLCLQVSSSSFSLKKQHEQFQQSSQSSKKTKRKTLFQYRPSSPSTYQTIYSTFYTTTIENDDNNEDDFMMDNISTTEMTANTTKKLKQRPYRPSSPVHCKTIVSDDDVIVGSIPSSGISTNQPDFLFTPLFNNHTKKK